MSDSHAEERAKGWSPKHWVGVVPYGLNQEHPNSILLADRDPITGARRDGVLMSAEDAGRVGLKDGDHITLRNQHGELHGRVKIDRIKPGCLQAHWPEANVIIPAGRLDPSGVPDYNTTVEVVGAACLAGAAVAAD